MMQSLSNEALLAAVSLIVAILTVLLPLFWRFLQSRRLRQEEAIHRESHNLRLFEALASGNNQLQLAAAAVLAERLAPSIRHDTKAEHRVIIRAFLAVTKDLRSSSSDPGTPPELSKFVADQIARNHKLPLSQFDWQNSQVQGAWWEGIQASNVDFWRANLRNVGMRGANLENSVFVEAKLDGAVLVNANLNGARLQRASLRGANLAGAKVVNTNFSGAKYDRNTKLPEGFDPGLAGMQLVDDFALGQTA